ncbi:hypothetical protein BZA77DRAFT_291887 [Pyronema omphalodes]|nr:hypothetical protein BZA77DRAFT_296884 [Pyronema omphalodes]KAI5817958.1 hypothetical protein BZA77DRAFT_291887 [Pyronema omphalodes]
MSNLDSPIRPDAKKRFYKDRPKKHRLHFRCHLPALKPPSFEYKTPEMASTERKRAASTTAGPEAVKREHISTENTATAVTVHNPVPSPTGAAVAACGEKNQQPITFRDGGSQSTSTSTETKLPKTKKCMQELDKEALTACNRALYASIPHTLSTSRARHHRFLKHVIARKELSGLLKLQEHVESYYMYYVILFSTTEQRDSAIKRLSHSSFSINDKAIKILAHPYGDPTFKPSNMWDVSASLLFNSTNIRDAIIDYMQHHVPHFKTSFTVREYAEYGYGTGQWAVRFGIAVPISVDEMKVGEGIAFVERSRETHCRGCGLTTHHVLKCKSPGMRAMHHEVVTGTTAALSQEKCSTARNSNVSRTHHYSTNPDDYFFSEEETDSSENESDSSDD